MIYLPFLSMRLLLVHPQRWLMFGYKPTWLRVWVFLFCQSTTTKREPRLSIGLKHL